jgi:hypothetical protein
LAKKKFGGYTISFAGDNTPVSKIFGNKPLAPSEMTKKLWGYVKRKRSTKRR